MLKIKILPLLNFVILISLTATLAKETKELPITAETCPDETKIPCGCWETAGSLQISCMGPSVNQTTLENTIREILRVNGIPEDRGVHIYELIIWNTEMTRLDLAPFYGWQLDLLTIEANENLTRLVTSGLAEDHGSIKIGTLYIYDCPVSREGLGDALKYFSIKKLVLEGLSLDQIQIQRTTDKDDGEFLPGLSAHLNLTSVAVRRCNIRGPLTSDRWNFQGLGKLESIDLQYNNINGIGENVFNFDQDSDALTIYLSYNQLNETSFHPNSGISQSGRKTDLRLSHNQITTIPLAIFQPYLDAHPENSLFLPTSPLVCDERLSWLKSRRDEFESRVSAYCDPNTSIFESDLIP